jgi:hypothetical protein
MSETTTEFTQATFEEFETVRRSGVCNMFDRSCVAEAANVRGFDNLVVALIDRKTYSRLLTAFSAWKEAQQ